MIPTALENAFLVCFVNQTIYKSGYKNRIASRWADHTLSHDLRSNNSSDWRQMLDARYSERPLDRKHTHLGGTDMSCTEAATRRRGIFNLKTLRAS